MKYEYSDEVVLIRCRNRSFNYSLPHQPDSDQNETLGTGFWLEFNDKKWLVTCFHVIDEAFHITIEHPKTGSERTSCKLWFGCPLLDLAVLRIEEGGSGTRSHNALRPLVKKGASSKTIPGPPIGATTLAIGYPLGQTHIKITKGVLSGQQNNFYQTDAPINMGNSGGPLMWDDRVIGVNARVSSSANDVGYAIPIHQLLNLLSAHADKSPIMAFPRSWGLLYNPPSDLSKKGVDIISILPNQLFSSSGCVPGDRWIAVDGHPINHLGELSIRWLNQKLTIANYLYHLPIGKQVSITILRGGRSIRDHVVITTESPRIRFRELYNEIEAIPYVYFVGLVMIPLCVNFWEKRGQFLRNIERRKVEDPILQETVDMNDIDISRCVDPTQWGVGRVVVSNVMRGSRLESHHIFRIGDVVASINSCPVHSIEDVRRIISSLPEKTTIVMMSGRRAEFPSSVIEHEEKKLRRIYQY